MEQDIVPKSRQIEYAKDWGEDVIETAGVRYSSHAIEEWVFFSSEFLTHVESNYPSREG